MAPNVELRCGNSGEESLLEVLLKGHNMILSFSGPGCTGGHPNQCIERAPSSRRLGWTEQMDRRNILPVTTRSRSVLRGQGVSINSRGSRVGSRRPVVIESIFGGNCCDLRWGVLEEFTKTKTPIQSHTIEKLKPL